MDEGNKEVIEGAKEPAGATPPTQNSIVIKEDLAILTTCAYCGHVRIKRTNIPTACPKCKKIEPFNCPNCHFRIIIEVKKRKKLKEAVNANPPTLPIQTAQA